MVDISVVSRKGQTGSIKLTEHYGTGSTVENPTVYARDYTVSYGLKTSNARALLSQVDKRSVYPFKLGYLAPNPPELRRLRLGLTECVQRRLLVAYPRLQA